MITPYTVFFALACVVSLASIATKARLLLLKLKLRFAVHEVALSNKLSLIHISEPTRPY